MPGLSGLEMQEALARHPARLPVIIVTGHGDLLTARRAFRLNAVDFLEKPFEHERLLEAIERALSDLQQRLGPAGIDPAAATLSAREKQVMQLVVDGCSNGEIGERLGISPRTVEVHKARLMAKLGTRNLPELIRVAQVVLPPARDR
jgi:RNA polymerase sigma factor (sigma-70 family)